MFHGVWADGRISGETSPRAARLALPTRLLRNPLTETDTPLPLPGPGTLEFGADSVWNQADM